jgi:hypothetical protein
VAVLLTLVTSGLASAETMRFKLRGQEAVAAFSSTSGCIVTDAFVAAMDADVKASPGRAEPDSRSFAIVSQYDRCTDTHLLDAFGETLLPPAAFVISKLESATLNTTLQVFDQVSGNSVPLSVNVTWTAGDGTSRVKDHYQFKSSTFTVNAKFNAISRDAEAQGSISDGVTNFAPQPAVVAMLNSVKAGVVEVAR